MAGSYKHCSNEDGTFRDNESFANQIENLGDAYEACEEMHFMIEFLAGGDKSKIAEASSRFLKSQLIRWTG